ncbi:unnamed protein product, partial [Thelazia callipaeda]|uniref:MSP domain-containing protein n=1 Tax=Thelazia callipaeda TaxID=103827 RepID=A0A0N5D906_THECL
TTIQDDSNNILNRIIKSWFFSLNISPSRIAFRVRTNAPTKYIVTPATGFLILNESVNVNVTNVDMKRYRTKHRFIVQAMKAKETDKDRRKIWDDSRAEDLDVVQCIRITTL